MLLDGGVSVDGADVSLEAVFAGECLVTDFALIASLAVAMNEIAMPEF